jgi:hypothetical protein
MFNIKNARWYCTQSGKAVWYSPKGVLAHLLAPCMLREGYDSDDQKHSALISDPTRNEQGDLEAIYFTGQARDSLKAWASLYSTDDDCRLANA